MSYTNTSPFTHTCIQPIVGINDISSYFICEMIISNAFHSVDYAFHLVYKLPIPSRL